MAYKVKHSDENGILDDVMKSFSDLITAGTGISLTPLSFADGTKGVQVTASGGYTPPAGTVTNSTQRWDGTDWVENTKVHTAESSSTSAIGLISDAVSHYVSLGLAGILGVPNSRTAQLIMAAQESLTNRFIQMISTVSGHRLSLYMTDLNHGAHFQLTTGVVASNLDVIYWLISGVRKLGLKADGTIMSDSLTASTLLQANASKEISSIANAAGYLYNDGSGVFSYATPSGVAQVNSDWDATSGVEEILNKPAIPEDIADLTDTTGIIPEDIADLTDTTGIIPDDVSDLTDTTGIIPEDIADLTDTGGIFTAIADAFDDKSDIGHNHNLNELTEKSYESLTDKPNIPVNHISFLQLDATLDNLYVDTPTPPYLPPITAFETLGEVTEGEVTTQVWRLELEANKLYAFELLLIIKKIGTSDYHEFEFQVSSSETCGQQVWINLEASTQIQYVPDISDMVKSLSTRTIYNGLSTNFAFVYEEDSSTPYERIKVEGQLSVSSTPTTITVQARNITRSGADGIYPAVFAQGSYMKAVECGYP